MFLKSVSCPKLCYGGGCIRHRARLFETEPLSANGQNFSVEESIDMKEADIDLTKTYDAVVVGSGAAGGMAAHVLTSHGMKVLLLEAGKKLNINKELNSMEWPYDHPRRGAIPPGSHALSLNEYNIRPRPYAKDTPYNHV